MAKKRPPKLNAKVLRFLAELTKDPNRLGTFILDPWGFLATQRIGGKPIPKRLWESILQAVTREVMDELLNAHAWYEH
jgi:hypothetical protein